LIDAARACDAAISSSLGRRIDNPFVPNRTASDYSKETVTSLLVDNATHNEEPDQRLGQGDVAKVLSEVQKIEEGLVSFCNDSAAA
jgi:hypothetical protein